MTGAGAASFAVALEKSFLGKENGVGRGQPELVAI